MRSLQLSRGSDGFNQCQPGGPRVHTLSNGYFAGRSRLAEEFLFSEKESLATELSRYTSADCVLRSRISSETVKSSTC